MMPMFSCVLKRACKNPAIYVYAMFVYRQNNETINIDFQSGRCRTFGGQASKLILFGQRSANKCNLLSTHNYDRDDNDDKN